MRKKTPAEPSRYDHQKIESKWQKRWEKQNNWQAEEFSNDKEKKYVLVEFPYPSGAGLHVGHVWGYTMGDVLARYYRMKGKNVLFPMGWDAFGLPTENYAIKTGISPQEATQRNVDTFKQQMQSMGFSFDWTREINTTDPEYYKWTQWIFLQFFNKGLAYKTEMPINWCPYCKSGLAHEEVTSDNTHERCGNQVSQRLMSQWVLKITAYADRLIKDLDLVDYSEEIKQQQINWIGRKEGASIKFKIQNSKLKTSSKLATGNIKTKKQPVLSSIEGYNNLAIEQFNNEISVFTTRPDTLYGATFIAIAPELAQQWINDGWQASDDVKEYIIASLSKSQLQRQAEEKEKTGVDTGEKAIHPLTSDKIPVFVADYVLMDYGTGAVMGVPAHDERDWEFAQKFGLEIKPVISTVRDGSREEEKSKTELTKNGGNFSSSPRSSSEGRNDHIPEPYTGPGAIINSGDWNGLQVPENIDKILNDIQNKGIGKRQTTYKLRDWIFSRQHYWGEPIPIIHCQKCGTIPVPEDQLPVTLPKINDYQPTEDGQSPLAKIKEWVKIKCPKCGGSAERETDTMPNWAGSSWYFLRYCDPHNDRQFTGLDKMAYFMPVDIYLGGAEHTTLHLLYSRFWHKILYDLELVLEPEPYRKRRNRGIVLGPDTRKMSKSFGNVINPDDEVKKVGADSLRIYELFMGPLNGTFPWDHRAETGMHRFLAKVWDQFQKSGEISTGKTLHKLHQTIKKVGEDIEQYKFNTAIAAMMELVNVWREDGESLSVEDAKKILLLLAPFTPHIAEELWQQHQKSEVRSQKSNVFNSIHLQPWPSYDETILTEDNVQVPVQVNGRVRATLKVDAADAKDETKIKNIAIADERVQKWIKDKEIQKVVFVPGRLINIVI